MRRQTHLSISLLAVFLTSCLATYDNITYSDITGGNSLWNGIIRDCKTFPTVSCIQKNVFHYLDDTLQTPKDVEFGEYMKFRPNKVDYTKYTKEANENKDEKTEEQRSHTPLEEVTNSLTDKGVKFLMTHDLELKLPSIFEGSTLKMSPRGFEGDGVLVKLDVFQSNATEITARSDQAQPRIFLKQITKFLFKRLFKNKLLTAFLSLLLVLKMIKVKLMFIAPLLIGVGTAKKIILKVLLFLFPFLSHLFKLCKDYHTNYHPTKYHHHHHQIAHLHVPPGPEHSGYPGHPGISLHHHGPPAPYFPQNDYFKHEPADYELSGPGLGPEYISNRNSYDQHNPPSGSEENEIKTWGMGQGHKGVKRGQQPKLPPIPTKSQIEQLALQAEKDALFRVRIQQQQMKLKQENLRLQEQLKKEIQIQEQLKIQAALLAQQMNPNVQQKQPTQQIQPASAQQQPQQIQPHHQQQSYQSPKASHDPFYSPILQRIDTILVGLGFNDEPCRERLICSMYKNPVKFSPHSNLISAELSRDSKELVKPTTSNDAVVRFYKYVQAARDGQDQRECLRLYPLCAVNTE